jgi:hypothetical protein
LADTWAVTDEAVVQNAGNSNWFLFEDERKPEQEVALTELAVAVGTAHTYCRHLSAMFADTGLKQLTWQVEGLEAYYYIPWTVDLYVADLLARTGFDFDHQKDDLVAFLVELGAGTHLFVRF